MKTYTTSEKIFYEKVLIRTLCKLPDYNPYKQTITPGSMLRKDLNLDSLDIVDTLCRLGDRYGITLDYGNFDKFQTVSDIYKSVITALTNKNREVVNFKNSTHTR